MNNIKIIWSAMVVITIIALIGLFSPSSKIVTQTIDNTVKGMDYTTNFPALGMGINDKFVGMTARRQTLTAATTTPCSILSPNATTSLIFADLNITTGTSTATYWQMGTSTNAFATTSISATYSVASGVTPALIFDPTSGIDSSIVAPNTYVVWKVGGVTIADSTKLLGTCQAIFVGI
jgi:hypothetical protein